MWHDGVDSIGAGEMDTACLLSDGKGAVSECC